MWESRRFTTLLVFMASYKDSFNLFNMQAISNNSVDVCLVLKRTKALIKFGSNKQGLMERTNSLLPFDTTWTAHKTTAPTILRCCANVFTELLISNDRGIRIQSHRFMGGIY
jgi:hypothetical protein